MVKVVRSNPSGSGSSLYAKWLIWGALVVLIVGVSVLVFSVLSHDMQDAACNCILCMFNRVPEDSEYVYNRYLPVISIVWVSLLIILVYMVRYYVNKRW